MRNILSRVREKYQIHQSKNTLKKISEEYQIPGTSIYHTPDAPIVDARDFHLVLVYDEMMKGRSEWNKIEPLVYGNPIQATTLENVEAWVHEQTNKVLAFSAFNKETKPVWQGQTGANPSPIKGELLKVTPGGVYILDKMLGNMINYHRVEVEVVSWLRKNYLSHFYSRTHTTPENPVRNKAWVYLANPEKGSEMSVYDGWKPLTIWRPHKREKGDGVYYHSHRSEASGRR